MKKRENIIGYLVQNSLNYQTFFLVDEMTCKAALFRRNSLLFLLLLVILSFYTNYQISQFPQLHPLVRNRVVRQSNISILRQGPSYTLDAGVSGFYSCLFSFESVRVVKLVDGGIGLCSNLVSVSQLERLQKCIRDGSITKFSPQILSLRDKLCSRCTSYGNASLIVDRQFWGNYYHSTIDWIMPLVFTKTILNSLNPSVGWTSPVIYVGKDVELLAEKTKINLEHILSLQSLRVASNLSRTGKCYRHVVVGFTYNWRLFHWSGHMNEHVIVNVLEEWGAGWGWV